MCLTGRICIDALPGFIVHTDSSMAAFRNTAVCVMRWCALYIKLFHLWPIFRSAHYTLGNTVHGLPGQEQDMEKVRRDSYFSMLLSLPKDIPDGVNGSMQQKEKKQIVSHIQQKFHALLKATKLTFTNATKCGQKTSLPKAPNATIQETA